jgi:hypothetical protein
MKLTPDVHLSTASTHVADTDVRGIATNARPAFNVALSGVSYLSSSQDARYGMEWHD